MPDLTAVGHRRWMSTSWSPNSSPTRSITPTPAIDLTVVAEDRPLRVEVANDRGPEARARQRRAESGAQGRGRGSWRRFSAELLLQTENGRSVVVAELVGERQLQPAGLTQLKQSGTVSLAPRRRSDPPPASSRSASSEQHGETCGRDEARAGEVDAECCVGRNIRQAAPQALERCGCRSLRRRGRSGPVSSTSSSAAMSGD